VASLLECRGISRAFGGIRAVDDLSIAVDRGEILGLIGPNGAGKTTVFNLISGFYAPSEGEILLEGSPLTGLRPDAIVRRGVARTFQNIRLFARQSALENVRTPLLQRHPRGIVPTLLGTPSVRREEKRCTARAMELLDLVGLAPWSSAAAGTLPYGHQRRLELARALASEPAVLLLDEPAAGMNPEETASLTALLATIAPAFDLTLLIIEHHMDLVMRFCSRIAVLHFGRLLAEGSPAEIRASAAVREAYLGKKSC